MTPSASTTTMTTTEEKLSPSSIRKLAYHRSRSWREVSTEPHFNIGILIGSTSVKDRHVSAISKPASQCTLTRLVVLHPIQGEDLCVSVDDWLSSNKISNGRGCKYIDEKEEENTAAEKAAAASANDDQQQHAEVHNIIFDDELGGAEHLGIDHGDDGWNKMLTSDDVDAVYIVLPPR